MGDLAMRNRQVWFEGARLGMFVHWDHASQQGLEVSWPLVGGIFALPHSQGVPVDQYHASAATFDPAEWDPTALAQIARRAGMRYVVFTAKHHSGYAMFKTDLSDFSAPASPCHRDLLGELIDALRAEDLRVGIYFSLSDWHHPDYPAFTEQDKPYRLGSSPPLPTPEQWDRYFAFLSGQLRELLSNYGRIDLVWFDGGWERPPEMWRPKELESLIRSQQPEILINDRLYGVGDFASHEQLVPDDPPDGRWETCLTMNESWGYNPSDTEYKSTWQLVHTICEVAAKGGNLLLNVSPTGTGTLPPEQLKRLEDISKWMKMHGEAIYETGSGLEPWQFYGPTTRNEHRVYLFLLMRPYDTVTVRGMRIRRVKAATHLSSGEALDFTCRTGILEGLSQDPLGEVVIRVPDDLIDPYATVIALDIEG